MLKKIVTSDKFDNIILINICIKYDLQTKQFIINTVNKYDYRRVGYGFINILFTLIQNTYFINGKLFAGPLSNKYKRTSTKKIAKNERLRHKKLLFRHYIDTLLFIFSKETMVVIWHKT